MPHLRRFFERLPIAVVWPLVCALWLAATPARAQDAFEIQVYDSETAPAGAPGIELHANHVFAGTTEPSAEGELPTQHRTHLTLEPHLGLTDWAELGGYLQAALTGDGAFLYGGFKLRLKLRIPGKIADAVGLALNLEFSDVPGAFEASRLGSEIRPVIDVNLGRLYASVNPILAFDLAGPLAFRPQFEPAAKVSVRLLPGFSVGGEYYAGLGPIFGALEPAGPPTQRVFAVLDYVGTFVDLNAGIGYGFSGDEQWVAKLILGLHPREESALPPEHH